MTLKGEELFEGYTAQLLMLVGHKGFGLYDARPLYRELIFSPLVRKKLVRYRSYRMLKVHYHFHKEDVMNYLEAKEKGKRYGLPTTK